MPEKVQSRLNFIINLAFVTTVVVIVYLALKYVIGWVLPFLIAFVLVSALHPLILLIKKNLKIKQELISIIVMALVYALAAVLIFLLVMQLIIVIRDGLQALPQYFNSTILPSLTQTNNALIDFIQELPPQWQEQVQTVQGDLLRTLQSFIVSLSQKGINLIPKITSAIPSFMIGFVFTIMLSFFMSVQYEKVVHFFRLQLSKRARTIIAQLRDIGVETVFKYLRAALTLMFITFVELSIGLLLLRTDNAIPVALGIAVFDALPFFGTGAIVIPWGVISLIQGNYKYAIGLFLLYAVVTVVRQLIEPKIVGDKLGLNPIITLTAIYIGFKLFGVLGMIAMPISTQIAMELHRKGTIRLFKEATPVSSPPPPDQATESPDNE